MTYEGIIVSEIAAGRNTIKAIRESQRTLMANDIRAVIGRLLYRGKIRRISYGKYEVVT